jgi:hypothetical protein
MNDLFRERLADGWLLYAFAPMLAMRYDEFNQMLIDIVPAHAIGHCVPQSGCEPFGQQ